MTTEHTISVEENTAGVVDSIGFQACGVHCDIRNKADGRLDLAIVTSQTPAATAGVFTLNDVVAAPVKFCRQQLSHHRSFRAVVLNSGNANACTGAQGDRDAAAMAATTASACGLPADSVLVCSTGRIGAALPMERLNKGISEGAVSLSAEVAAGRAAAEAILTSDTRSKTATVRLEIGGKTVTVAGMAKGAGMIEPNMATMLAVLTSDADVPPPLLQTILSEASERTFNRISVDGDMSTNDTVLLMANGASGVKIDESTPQALQQFRDAVRAICLNLAAKIVGDGEKITKVVRVRIDGARTEEDAGKIARAIGNSLLVKTSWYGNDPNWGRLMDAAGYARTGLIEEKVDLSYDTVPVLRAGNPVWDNRAEWKQVVSNKHFTITLHLNLGDASYELLAADLSEAYVNFNKSE